MFGRSDLLNDPDGRLGTYGFIQSILCNKPWSDQISSVGKTSLFNKKITSSYPSLSTEVDLRDTPGGDGAFIWLLLISATVYFFK